MIALCIALLVLLTLHLINRLSYLMLKEKIVRKRKWDLNICCGKTDGGGINADIVKHEDVPSFVKVDIYNLPFEDKQFDTVLCSHTMEHVKEPDRFFRELQRVEKRVTIVIPPLWDILGIINLWEHKWIFVSFKKVHHRLPPRVRLPLSRVVHQSFGQKISA